MNGLVTPAAENDHLKGLGVVGVMPVCAISSTMFTVCKRDAESLLVRCDHLGVFGSEFVLTLEVSRAILPVLSPLNVSHVFRTLFGYPIPRHFFRTFAIILIPLAIYYATARLAIGMVAYFSAPIKFRDWFNLFASATFLISGHGASTSLAGSRQGLAPGGFIHYITG